MRAFVGYELGEETVGELAGFQEKVGKRSCIRWIKRENLHITVVFLGKVDKYDIPSVKSVIKDFQSKYEKIIFTVGPTSVWPNTKNPKIVSVQLNHPEKYAQMQANLANKLEKFAPKIGKLKPAHITLGRITKSASGKNLKSLKQTISANKPSLQKITVSALNLYKSTLSRSGSNYQIV